MKRSHLKFPKDIQLLRKELYSLVPKEAFKPQKSLLFSYCLMWVINGLLTYFILKTDSTLMQILVSCALGFTWTLTLFYTHIFIHGHVIQNKFLARVLALPCAYFGVISPGFWSHWHHLHHRFGTLDENISGFQTINWVHFPGLKIFFDSVKPDQSRSISFLYLFFWKAIAFSANQFFFFFNQRFPKQINPYIVASELLFFISIHALVWTFLDWQMIVLIEIIPWTIQNFLSSAFVVTNHHPKLILHGSTFHNTCSVHLGSWILDSLFLNIGYHIEHHIFPECNPKYLPTVSSLLKQKYPTEYKMVSLPAALKTIFSEDTPSDFSVFGNNRKIQ